MAKIEITGISVNVRSGPGLDFKENLGGIGPVLRGQEFPWLHTLTDIKDPNYKWHGFAGGWVRSDLAKVVADGATGTLSGSAGIFWPRPCEGQVTPGMDYRPPEHRGIDIWSDPPSMIYGIPGAQVIKTFHCIPCGTDSAKQSALGNFSEAYGFGYGNHVVLYKDGYYVLYAHLKDIRVSPGWFLGAKTELGRMGQSGNADGNHLHLEVKTNPYFDGTVKGLVNPRKVFVI